MSQVGVDEWVARHEERIELRPGPLGAAARAWRRVPPAWRLVLFTAVVASVPFVTASDFVIRVGVNTLLLALLALGLNVVVGWAGLLDLGYIAFYGFGAYSYALLSSEQIGVHLASWLSLPIVVASCAVLGLLLGLSSWRLLGDYLAIVTLFFGQVFVEVVVNLDRVRLPGADAPTSITGGPNGIPGIDPLHAFGYELVTPTNYYYVALVAVVALVVLLHHVDRSRTGRAWRALRDDPLAAELMTMPVKRLKLTAFACGAAIAGLAGCIFAALQIGVFPQNFETPFLILIYAAVILGGSGSIVGALAGAAAIGIGVELLRDPEQARFVFYVATLAAVAMAVRSWPARGIAVGGAIVLGLAVHAILSGAVPDAVAGSVQGGGALASAMDAWVVVPESSRRFGNWCFVALVVGVLALTRVHGRWRVALLAPLIYLAALTWENRLVLDPSVTRLFLLGALLIVVMNSRPQGLFGERRVERL